MKTEMRVRVRMPGTGEIREGVFLGLVQRVTDDAAHDDTYAVVRTAGRGLMLTMIDPSCVEPIETRRRRRTKKGGSNAEPE